MVRFDQSGDPAPRIIVARAAAIAAIARSFVDARFRKQPTDARRLTDVRTESMSAPARQPMTPPTISLSGPRIRAC